MIQLEPRLAPLGSATKLGFADGLRALREREERLSAARAGDNYHVRAETCRLASRAQLAAAGAAKMRHDDDDESSIN